MVRFPGASRHEPDNGKPVKSHQTVVDIIYAMVNESRALMAGVDSIVLN